MKVLPIQELSDAGATGEAGGDPLLERMRRLALAAANGDAGAPRVVLLTLPRGPARARVIEALGRGVVEDGGRFAVGRAAPSLTGKRAATPPRRAPPERDPLAGARALARALGVERARAGVAALARETCARIESGETWTVAVLDGADEASADTARWWWSIARRIATEDSLAPALLVAVVAPRAVAAPVSAWESIEALLTPGLAVERVEAPPVTHDRGSAPASAVAAAKTDAAHATRRSSPARRAPLPGFRLLRSLLRDRAGVRPASAREAAIAAGLAAMRGDANAVIEAAESAASLAERADDLTEDAAAELALACAALAAEAPDAEARAHAAATAAALAGSPALAAGSMLARACALATRGDDLAAREALLALDRRRLPLPFRRLAAWLDAWLAFESAPGESGAARPPEGDRVAAWAAIARGDGRRARALFESTNARASLRTLDLAAASGLASTGRADATTTIAALAPIAGASTIASLAAAALDAVLALVPARGGTLAIGSPADARTAVRRASALVRLDGENRLTVPLRPGAAAETIGTVVLTRESADPPFTRDERRLAESVGTLAAARLAALERSRAAAEAEASRPEERGVLGAAEREVLLRALSANGRNLSRTARALGLSRNGLKLKLARHGLR